VTRFSAALAAGSAVLALLLAGCGTEDSGDSAQNTAAATSAPQTGAVDNAKAGMFVVGYRNAFPALAQDRDDSEITELFTGICDGIDAGESQDAVVADIVERTGSAATTDEAQAIFVTAQYMC